MPVPDGKEEEVASGLVRALAALGHAQEAWLDDLHQVCLGDPAFVTAFRRWEERLTLVKLRLHRAEGRLLNHLLAVATPRPSDDAPAAPSPDARPAVRRWRERLEHYCTDHRIDTAYRRLDDALDHDQEAVTADIITDLARLAEVAETTGAALEGMANCHDRAELEELAFFRVISPWKTRGLPALLDVLRWLAETLREREDW
jgi:hypothetical protein